MTPALSFGTARPRIMTRRCRDIARRRGFPQSSRYDKCACPACPFHSPSGAAFFRGEVMPEKPQHVDLHLWLGDQPGIQEDTVIEQAIPLTSYNQVISMLWLPEKYR